MTFFGILKIGPLEPCGNEFQSTGSHRLTVCTSTDSYYYFSAYTWGQKRNTFPQGSSGSIFKIPKNVISYEPTEPTFEWAKLFCDISLTLMYKNSFCYLSFNTGFVSWLDIKFESWNISFSLWDSSVLGKSIFQICIDAALPVSSIAMYSVIRRAPHIIEPDCTKK